MNTKIIKHVRGYGHKFRVWMCVPKEPTSKIVSDTILLATNSSGETEEIFGKDITISYICYN